MRRELHTARLTLRPPRAGDAPLAQARWGGLAPVWRYLDGEPSPDQAAMARRLAWDEARWLKRSAWTWLLMHGGDGPVGLVQLLPQRLDGACHHLRMGYLLAPAWQGRGLMHEAVAAVCAEAFAGPACWRIDAVCDVDNAASARLLAALGWQREGLLRGWARHPAMGTAPRDCWLYAALRGEWSVPGHHRGPNRSAVQHTAVTALYGIAKADGT